MPDDNSGALSIICFGTGVLVGAAFVYLILKKEKEPVVTQASVLAQSRVGDYVTDEEFQDMRVEMRRVWNENQILHDSLATLKNGLQQVRDEGQILRDSLVLVKPQILTGEQKNVSDSKVQSVQNEEAWEFKKDSKGRIQGVIVHRKVTPIE